MRERKNRRCLQSFLLHGANYWMTELIVYACACAGATLVMYLSLHNRSCYSFELALTRPDQLADFAARHGMSAIALTDRDGLYGAVGFQQACERAGVKPIFGLELTLAEGVEVTLLAQTRKGYANLCRLASLRHLGEAAVSVRQVCEHAGDVVGLVGTNGKWPIANSEWRANELREAFANRIYMELAIHRVEDVAEARRRARWADEAGLPVVASCESRCLKRGQGLLLRALASMGTLTLLDQPHADKPEGHWHLRTPAEMQRLFARRPDALRNTFAIAEQCDVSLELGRSRFPAFDSPDGRRAIDHLRELSIAGCRRRYVDEPPFKNIGGRRATFDEALKRLERELGIIEQVHYAEYFLVFHEIVEYCRREGIDSLARGSAADSLVCYALGVSHACPFRFDLPFDRFINPERAKFSKMADIDLDLPWDRRDEVIRWVYDRWGHDRVAMIGAPNTFHARAAVADLGKVYGLPPHEVHRTTKLLPHVTSWNLPEAIRQSPEARDVPIGEEPYCTILHMARELDGLPRHWSMHPCGLVVSPEPLCDLVPVQRSPKGPLVAQYDMHAIEDLGFVKVDLLGQAGLSVLRDAVEGINGEWRMANDEINAETPKRRNAETLKAETWEAESKDSHCEPDRCSPHSIRDLRRVAAVCGHAPASCVKGADAGICHSPLAIRHCPLPINLARDVDYSDSATWDLIASGNARGVHHIESPAMTSLLQQCNCRDIDCLTTVVAIIRPGAANQGKKEAFARRHQRMEPPQYAHPSVVSVLEATYGLMVFEEHILQIAVEFAGMNLGRADVLRRALNKENRVLIRQLRGEFWSCAEGKGRRRDEIEAVWGLVEGFCGFMFNKAHSAEYAIEAFQGAWLKLRFPAHYIAAILSNYRGFYANSATLPQILYVLEALRLGIGFLPPCVNRSGRKFLVETQKLQNAETPKRQNPETPKRRNAETSKGEGGGSECGNASGGMRGRVALRGEGVRTEELAGNPCAQMFALPLAWARPDPWPCGPPLAWARPDTRSCGPPLAWGVLARASGTDPAKSEIRNPKSDIVDLAFDFQHSAFGIPHSPVVIRIPVSHVQGLSAEFVERYHAERERGAFESVADLVERCRPGESEAAALLDGGALDGFGRPRPQMFWQLHRLYRRRVRGMDTLFGGGERETGMTPPVELTAPDLRQRAKREMDLLGFPVSIDPLTFLGTDDQGRSIDESRYVKVADLGRHVGRRVTVCGLMVADRINATLTHELMKFVTLGDRTGFVETIVFPDAYRRFGHLTAANAILEASGIVESFENGRGWTLRVERLSVPRRGAVTHPGASRGRKSAKKNDAIDVERSR